MKSACSSSAPGAFATPSAGFGYFATAEHYRHLAKAAADALHRGGVVLVSGDPPVYLAMLIEALRNAATPRAVIAISCGPALDFSALYAGGGSPPQGQATPGSAQDGATGPTVGGCRTRCCGRSSQQSSSSLACACCEPEHR